MTIVRSCVVFVVAVCVLTGCKKDPTAEDLLAPSRPQATANIEQLRKLRDAMAKAPRITNDAVNTAPGAVVLESTGDEKLNAAVLYEEDLPDFESIYSKEHHPMPIWGLIGN